MATQSALAWQSFSSHGSIIIIIIFFFFFFLLVQIIFLLPSLSSITTVIEGVSVLKVREIPNGMKVIVMVKFRLGSGSSLSRVTTSKHVFPEGEIVFRTAT